MKYEKIKAENAQLLKESFEKKFCLAGNTANCSKEIIHSHAISKCFLKHISENNHVMTPDSNIYTESGKWVIKSKGINQTKCFYGFCSYHDDKLFSSFEKREFIADTQQLIDLSLRSVYRDIHQKKCLIHYINEMAKKHPNSNLDFCKNDYLTHSQKMISNLKYLINGIHRNYRLFAFIIKTTPIPINSSGVMFPTHLWDKTPIQQKTNKKHGFIYNLITLNDCSYFILLTVESKHSNIHNKYLCSLEKITCDQLLISHIIQISLLFNDIFVMKPSWYNKQVQHIKVYIDEIMNVQHGNYTGLNYVHSTPNFSLLFDEFTILDRKNINF